LSPPPPPQPATHVSRRRRTSPRRSTPETLATRYPAAPVALRRR